MEHINHTQEWTLKSWQNFSSIQLPEYAKKKSLHETLVTLAQKPNLISENSVQRFHKKLTNVACGEAFIIQMGDCAESFDGSNKEAVFAKLTFMQQIVEYLQKIIAKPIIPIARIAGQYAKPRTDLHQLIDNKLVHNYRGDAINGVCQFAREPDPKRMLLAHDCAQRVMNYILEWEQQSALEIFTSHEALLLHYEQGQSKQTAAGAYNLATHFPWLGMRTAIGSPAHHEYLRGILNPVAIKVSTMMTAQMLIALIKLFNPNNIPGKISLIHRFGVNTIQKFLPVFLKKITDAKLNVIWLCDPMHGNTRNVSGAKIRYVEDIRLELQLAKQLHDEFKVVLSGVHLESTPDDILECTFNADQPQGVYTSLCDPRLNKQQVLDVLSVLA